MNTEIRELPLYWEEHLEEKIRKICELKKEAGDAAFCTAMITDFHWRQNEKYSVPMLERVLSECGIPYFFQGGDIVSGSGICPKESLFDEIREYRAACAAIEGECLYVEGNHDRAYSTFEAPAYYAENIPRAEFEAVYFAPIREDKAKAYSDGGYYYVDDENKKVRYIVLNSQDVPSEELDERGHIKYNSMRNFGFLKKQTEWFASAALNVPSREWSVIIASHLSPNGEKAIPDYHYNFTIMTNILRAFENGETYEGEEKHENPLFDLHISVDFTGRGGNVLAWLGGHIHRNEYLYENGVLCIDTASDAAFLSIYPDREGTLREQSFGVFVFDTKARKCNVVRIGEGEDLVLAY